MPSTALESVASIGFAVCALASLILLVLLAARGRGQGSGRMLLVAVASDLVWSALLALSLHRGAVPVTVLNAAEAARLFCWVLFLVSLIHGAAAGAGPERDAGRTLKRVALGLGGTVALLAIIMVVGQLIDARLRLSLAAALLASVLALVSIEQVWRNTAPRRRWAMKFLALALIAKFAVDLTVYTEALLFLASSAEVWVARGYLNALLIPMIAVSAARNPAWKLDIGVSRHVVFHTATLTIAGTFLLLAAIAGYYLKTFGGSAGTAAATTLAFAVCVGLLVLATSNEARTRLRILLAKHFFSYRYDYRQEWLRLTRLLSEDGSPVDAYEGSLPVRAIRGLGQLVASPGGALWMKDQGGDFVLQARFGLRDVPPLVPGDEPLLGAIAAREWIVELRPSDAGAAATGRPPLPPPPAWLAGHADAGLLVPLLLGDELVGLVLLARSPISKDFHWETRDVLKIAARQVAAFLSQRSVLEELIQARQFESFNRMSAFVAHDLKNLVAQLGLLTRNARSHGQDPDFQQDMIETVQNVTDRLQALLLHFRTGAKPIEQSERVELRAAIIGAIRSRGELRPQPRVEIDPRLQGVQVTAHPARLERVLGHLVQNAAEATTPLGSVLLTATLESRQVVIQIADDGVGMTDDFIRTGLFQPFRSTKTTGMGIGAFESREYLREIGGSVDVTSRLDHGTTFSIRLPLGDGGV